MQRIYACISIQVTVDHAEHQGMLEREELLKVPNASGKAAFWKSFVCIDICGHDCRWWNLRPIIKVYLLVVCVCVFVYSRDSTRQRAHVRELKVILLLVLGRHECVRGKFYINSILTLIN